MADTVDPITERLFRDGSAYSLITDPENTKRHQEFDQLFKAPLTIDVAHHEVHEGDAFFRRVYDEDAAIGDVIQIYLITPASAIPQKRIHLIVSHEASGEHLVKIIEGVTLSTGGADAGAFNRNRGSVKTTATQAFKVGSDKGTDAMTYSGGTTIDIMQLGSGRTLGGESRGVNEWVLAPDTTYMFEVEAAAAGIYMWLSVDWYEHTDG